MANQGYPSDCFVGHLPGSCDLSSNGNLSLNGVKTNLLKNSYNNGDVVGCDIKDGSEILNCIPYKRKRVYFTLNETKLGMWRLMLDLKIT